jgi:hypothetical protein
MDYQDYQIALSPTLGLTAEEFTAAWNADPECRALSEAQLVSGKGTTFEPITLSLILITIGTGVAANLLSDLIKNLIRRTYEKKQSQLSPQSIPPTQPHKHVHIEEIKKQDGTNILMVDTEEQ